MEPATDGEAVEGAASLLQARGLPQTGVLPARECCPVHVSLSHGRAQKLVWDSWACSVDLGQPRVKHMVGVHGSYGSHCARCEGLVLR